MRRARLSGGVLTLSASRWNGCFVFFCVFPSAFCVPFPSAWSAWSTPRHSQPLHFQLLSQGREGTDGRTRLVRARPSFWVESAKRRDGERRCAEAGEHRFANAGRVGCVCAMWGCVAGYVGERVYGRGHRGAGLRSSCRGRPFPSPPLLPSVGSPAGSGGVQEFPPPPEFFFFPPYPPAEPCAMDCVSGPPRGFAGVAAAHLAADDQTNASCLSSPLPTRPSLYPTAWGGHAKNAGTGHDAARHPPPPSPLP